MKLKAFNRRLLQIKYFQWQIIEILQVQQNQMICVDRKNKKSQLPCKNQFQLVCRTASLKPNQVIHFINLYVNLFTRQRMLAILLKFEETLNSTIVTPYQKSNHKTSVYLQSADRVVQMAKKLEQWEKFLNKKKQDMAKQINSNQKELISLSQFLYKAIQQKDKKIEKEMKFQRQLSASSKDSNSQLIRNTQQIQQNKASFLSENDSNTKQYKINDNNECSEQLTVVQLSKIANQQKLQIQNLKQKLQKFNSQSFKKIKQSVPQKQETQAFSTNSQQKIISNLYAQIQNLKSQKSSKDHIIKSLQAEIKTLKESNKQEDSSQTKRQQLITNYQTLRQLNQQQKKQISQLENNIHIVRQKLALSQASIMKLQKQKSKLKEVNIQLQKQLQLNQNLLKLKQRQIESDSQSQFYSDFLFDSKAIRDCEQPRLTIENKKIIHQILQKRPVHETNLLYSFDRLHPQFFHEYISDKKNILVIAKTQSGVILGGFATSFDNLQQSKQNFSIFSILKQENESERLVNHLVSSKTQNAAQKAQLFLIFGSSQLRFKAKSNEGYSNVGGYGSFYRSANEKYVSYQQFLGSDQREFKMQLFQIFQVKFK